MNYPELIQLLPLWAGHTKVADIARTVIELAEARIRNDLLIRRMELAVHGVFDGAVIFLPAECDAIQRLYCYVGERELSVPYIDSKSAERYTGTVGDPIGYTMGDQALILYPSPSTARNYTLYYVPAIPALTDGNPDNWLLTRASNIYVFAACLEAASFLQDQTMMGVWEGRYKQAIDAMFNASERQRMPSNTPLVARPYRALTGNR